MTYKENNFFRKMFIVTEYAALKNPVHRCSDVDQMYHKFRVTYVMRGFRREAGGSELSPGKLCHHQATSLTHKRNAIETAFHWRANGGPLRIMIPLYPL